MGSWRHFLITVAGFVFLATPASSVDFSAQGDCLNTSASVSISDVDHTCPSTLSADGSWSVSAADGVELTYKVAGTVFQREVIAGTWGSWTFLDTFQAADGTYSFSVTACPRVDDGSGYTVCDQHCDTASTNFPVDCTFSGGITGCLWDCDFMTNACTGTCNAEVSNGSSPYYHTWGVAAGVKPFWYPTKTSFSTSFTSPSLSCDVGDDVYLYVEESGGLTLQDDWTCGFN